MSKGINVNKEIEIELADKLIDVLNQDVDNIKTNVVGKILTIVDAAISDERQLKAVKDLIRQAFWTQEAYGNTWHIVNSFLEKHGEGKLMPTDYWIDHRHDIPRPSYFK